MYANETKNGIKKGDKVRNSPNGMIGTVTEIFTDGEHLTVAWRLTGRLAPMHRVESTLTVHKVTP